MTDGTYRLWGGWILPNGVFVECAGMMHNAIACEMLGHDDGEVVAENAGWIKIAFHGLTGGWCIFYKPQGRPSQKQIDAVFDWAQAPSDPKEKAGRTMTFNEWMEMEIE